MEQENITVKVDAKKQRRKARAAAPVGIALIVLSIVGLVTIIVGGINLARAFFNNDKEKIKFERMLLPVVMYDPPAFESASALDQNMLLQTAMWSAILNNDNSKWSKDEMDFSLIPASELDVQAARLFGSGLTIEHKDFGDYDITYLYDPENKVYSVPPSAESGLYTPSVVDIKKTSEGVELKVGYVPPGNFWDIDENGNRFEPDPDKYMMYIMVKNENGDYYLKAIRDIASESSFEYEDVSIDEDLLIDNTSSGVGSDTETFGDDPTASFDIDLESSEESEGDSSEGTSSDDTSSKAESSKD